METLKVSSFFNLRLKKRCEVPVSRALEIKSLKPILASQTAKVNKEKSR